MRYLKKSETVIEDGGGLLVAPAGHLHDHSLLIPQAPSIVQISCYDRQNYLEEEKINKCV
jgi:hypothetical protein